MPARTIRVVACRGDRTSAPENTLPAFEAAIAAGADDLYADVRVTKDGVPVLCRDASLFRTTGKELLVKEAPLADVQTLDAGATFGEGRPPVRVPTLEEFITAFVARAPLILELKEPGSVLPTVQVLQKLAEVKAFERVLAVSAERSLLSSLRMLDSRVRLGQIMERHSICTVADVKLFGATAVLPFWDDAHRGYVDEARKLNLDVLAYGVEAAEALRQLMPCAPEGVLYDNPREAVALLAEAGLHEAPGGRGAGEQAPPPKESADGKK